MIEPKRTIYSTRLRTGVDGLDTILQGGLFQGHIYLVMGRPGAGKTILGNQICFHHASKGGRALYITLLSEAHEALLAQMRGMQFFDPTLVGTAVVYLNGYTALRDGGLDALLKMLRDAIRAQGATLLVVDGMVMAELAALPNVTAYKRFIQDLQAWVGLMGVTVVLLTSTEPNHAIRAEHTMVDGIVELRSVTVGPRSLRELAVAKLRGSGFLEGCHTYLISSEGLVVYPRFEALFGARRTGSQVERRVTIGIEALDELLGGGVLEGSTTLLLGPTGSGKTVLGMHFLHAGVRAGEPALCFGFFENPAAIRAKMARFGMNTEGSRGPGLLVEWQPSAELLLDAIGHRLLDLVRTHGVRRLFIDGLAGLRRATANPDRVPPFFSVLVEELGALGVTTVLTGETPDIFSGDITVPTEAASALCHNILTLRQVQVEAQILRLLALTKTRDSAHARGLYEFEVSSAGVVIGRPFELTQGAAKGVPARGKNAPQAPRARKGTKRK
ncbi:ATPase domain-containing protein [Polyangium sp. 6x1]|uniref:ATPase domain-containing protein n=1 Tax=Polyangium sp. 6x1 TaxID=3042689 RepID=UPI002482CD6B|nr:ATPase domain-containing protein [Polyangium sp. 6x1]MDI1449001.1 ATPase domain-containing protein [Polyangium sp. 6x1]